MKYFSSLVVSLVVFALAVPAHAGTLSLSPATTSLSVGQTASFILSANPGAEKNYTVKALLSFPANLIEVTGFTFNSAWTPLSQSGYDAIDNTAGTMVKTGGYPAGFATNVPFGTVTVRAKAAGSATLSVTGASLMLNETNGNTYTSGGVTSATIAIGARTQPTPAVSRVPAPRATVSALVSPSPSTSVAPSPSATPNLEVGTIGSSFVDTTWFKGLIALFVVVLLGLWLSRRRKSSF